MSSDLAARLAEPGISRWQRIIIRLRAILDIVGCAPSERLRTWRKAPLAGRVVGPSRSLLSGASFILDGILQDFRWAVRSVRRGLALSIAAVATIAIGLGATTAVFSLVHTFLLKPLPYSDADRLVEVWPEQNFNKALVRRISEAVPALEEISGISNWTLTLTGLGMPEELLCSLVSVDHFELLGVQPAVGRSFRPEEARSGEDQVVILSHDVWMRRFGGDLGILGQAIPLSGAEADLRTVIGVMPKDYRPVAADTETPQLWAPLTEPESWEVTRDPSWYVNTRIGRLAPGATLAEARAQLKVETLRLYGEGLNNIDEETAKTADLVSLSVSRRTSLAQPLLLLLAAVSLVLLIGCANVANLLLARGEARAREISMRHALGASRARIIRQLLVESLLLALAGAVLGLAFAHRAVQLLGRYASSEIPRIREVVVDPVMLLFALAASLLAALLFGSLPALRGSRPSALAGLRGGVRGAFSPSGSRLSGWLVGGEIALALIVLVASGLMLRSLSLLYRVDPGFSTENVLTLRVNPPSSKYPGSADFNAAYDRVVAKLEDVAGVETVGAIQLLPLTLNNWAFPSYPDGYIVAQGDVPPSIAFRVVRPGYFATLDIPLRSGRLLTDTDGLGDDQALALVNETLARRFWPDGSAIDREIRLFGPDGQAIRIIGVVGDVHQFRLDRKVEPEIYVTAQEWPWKVSLSLVLRTTGPPIAMAGQIRETIRSVDPDLVISNLERLDKVVARSAGSRRFVAILLGGFGMVALVLGGVGVFGVSSYVAVRHLPEVGLRKALGATRGALLSHSLGRGLRPIALGLVFGLAGAVTTSRLLGSLLYGVGSDDPLTLTGAFLFLFLTSVLATAVPAWRASRVDPMKVLRQD